MAPLRGPLIKCHGKTATGRDVRTYKLPNSKSSKTLSSSVISDVLSLVKEAKQPVLLIGQGIKHSKAEKELQKFIDILGIPTTHTILAMVGRHEGGL